MLQNLKTYEKETILYGNTKYSNNNTFPFRFVSNIINKKTDYDSPKGWNVEVKEKHINKIIEVNTVVRDK